MTYSLPYSLSCSLTCSLSCSLSCSLTCSGFVSGLAVEVSDADDIVLCLELLTNASIRSPAEVKEFWPLLHQYFQRIFESVVNPNELPSASNTHSASHGPSHPIEEGSDTQHARTVAYVVERAAVNLLRASIQAVDAALFASPSASESTPEPGTAPQPHDDVPPLLSAVIATLELLLRLPMQHFAALAPRIACVRAVVSFSGHRA